MCDELIAAHGDLLPPLSRATLIPASGKQFAPCDPRELRRNWEAKQRKAAEGFIRHWQIIGPFKSAVAGEIDLDLATPIDREVARATDGGIDLKAAHEFAGEVFRWRPAEAAAKNGHVNLS